MLVTVKYSHLAVPWTAVGMPLELGGRITGLAHGEMFMALPASCDDGWYSHSDRSRVKTSTTGPRCPCPPAPRYHRIGTQFVVYWVSNGINCRYTPALSISPNSLFLPTNRSAIPPPGARELIGLSFVPHVTAPAYPEAAAVDDIT